MRSPRPALFVPLLLASPAAAQQLLYTFEGDSAFDRLGSDVCAPGDLDGDGLPDLLVGSPGDGARQVRAFSGADGSFLFALNGDTSGDGFGDRVAALGDVDGDQVGDFAVSARPGGYVRVFSGASHTPLYTVSFPTTVYTMVPAGVGDATGDGVGDLAIGFIGPQTRRVSLHSGLDGSLVWEVPSSVSYGYFGSALDGAGDVNADGRADLVVGDYAAGGVESGTVVVLSGTDGAELHRFEGADHLNWLGRAVAGIGDVDGDGHDDVAGVAQIDTTSTYDEPYLRVWSGASGALLHHLDAGGCELSSPAVAGVGDLDGDGAGDLLLSGNPYCGGPDSFVRLYSGASGALLWELPVEGAGAQALAAAGDVNGDGILDFVLGDLYAKPGGLLQGGEAYVYGLTCAPLPERYCAAAPNSVGAGALMSWRGTTSVTRNDLVLGADGCPPGQPGLFYYGPTTAQVPFGDGLRCVGAGGLGTFRLNPAGSADGAGSIERGLDLTAPPAGAGPGAITAGSTWHFQLWYRDPGFGSSGFNLSDGLRASFCP